MTPLWRTIFPQSLMLSIANTKLSKDLDALEELLPLGECVSPAQNNIDSMYTWINCCQKSGLLNLRERDAIYDFLDANSSSNW